MRAHLLAVLASACVSSATTTCPDGVVCPANTTCHPFGDPVIDICATPAQVDACAGHADFDPCTLTGVDAARCYGGACVRAGCGNRLVDPEEQCDDGNTVAQDGCAADCRSNERCGNGVVDALTGEVCDDGNGLSHDGCSSTCLPERPHWIHRRLTPPLRVDPAMAYDPILDRIVVFGGFGSSFLHDTWEWTGGDWIERRLVGPTARTGAAAAFDGARVILFGGVAAEEPLGDTWSYDGVAWTLIPAGGPPGRAHHAMAFDARRGRIVLFGGDGGSGPLDDTWEWDGAAWSERTTTVKPPAVVGASMAYDPARGVIVLAGGGMTDVWELDDAGWHDVAPAANALPVVAMTFDPSRQQVVGFGATSGPEANRIYAWDGSTWTDLAPPTQPFERHGHALAAMHGRVVMIGTPASPPLAETWLFENGGWTAPTAPSQRANAGVAYDDRHDTVVLFGGFGGSPLDDTWVQSDRGWQKADLAVHPTARQASAMTFDPIAGDVLLYSGGPNFPNTGVPDTWTWDGATWTLREQSGPAPGRLQGSIAFDGTSVVVFGGMGYFPGGSTFGELTDGWRWTGSTWTDVTDASLQMATGSSSQRACFDRTAGHPQLVIHSPVLLSASAVSPSTWSHDATGWHEHVLAIEPPLAEIQPAWNPARRRVVLTPDSRSMWEWDGSAWARFAPVDADAQSGGKLVTAIDGGGVVETPGFFADFGAAQELRWDAPTAEETCGAFDSDGDGLVACADPDCWRVCTPLCMPGQTCDAAAPHCGDGTCDPTLESCRSCPDDCTCDPVCGDFICDPGEACPGDCH